ncbi:MAG: LacI family transcriptional regulator [Clostridium sp.]|nr:LacI family transcriptional regulator [Clostridium sp.]
MVTIKDISKALGVSPATVSKALNGYKDINPETAARIRQAAKDMHYLPNIAARQLKTNISHNIGVLFVDDTNCGLTHEYFSSILNSAKEELELLGYDITFISQNIAGQRASFLEHAKYRNCDGVLIACVDFSGEQVIELVKSDIPTVTIDYQFDERSAVISDNIEGSYELTKYLLENGHRKIALIHGEETLVTRKRLNGFYRALREYDVTLPDDYIIEGNYHDVRSSAAATKHLMSLPDRPTAIMYPDDFAYLGGMAELERMNISVPDDVSVTGYDGIHLSQVLRPRLTTYAQDSEQIGKLSARKLIEQIEDRKNSVPETIMVSGKLLEGQSVRKIN